MMSSEKRPALHTLHLVVKYPVPPPFQQHIQEFLGAVVTLYPFEDYGETLSVATWPEQGERPALIIVGLLATPEREEGSAVYPSERQEYYLKLLFELGYIQDVLLDGEESLIEAMFHP